MRDIESRALRAYAGARDSFAFGSRRYPATPAKPSRRPYPALSPSPGLPMRLQSSAPFAGDVVSVLAMLSHLW